MADRLAVLETRLDVLGVDDLTVAAFIGVWNEADDQSRTRIRAMGDLALLRYVKSLPPAKRRVEDATFAELTAQADDMIERSVKDVLRWVDGNVERAELALRSENSRPEPRSSLVAALTVIIEAD